MERWQVWPKTLISFRWARKAKGEVHDSKSTENLLCFGRSEIIIISHLGCNVSETSILCLISEYQDNASAYRSLIACLQWNNLSLMPRTHDGVDHDQVQPVHLLYVVRKVSVNWAQLLHSLAPRCQIWLFEIQKRLINNLKTFYSTPPLFMLFLPPILNAFIVLMKKISIYKVHFWKRYSIKRKMVLM